MAVPRWILLLALVCCFFSGLAGLVYEIVWARYLALFLGHTSYAVVAVLVAFMGGLALGNAWLGKHADRVRQPLRFYAGLEIGIGAYALVFPAYYKLCHSLFVSVAGSWQPGSAGMLALKFAFSLLTVLLPTVLMGGTLPSLVRFATASLSELRSRVASLYWINSAGAVVGCIVADFWWIPALGLSRALVTAAAINLAAGFVALLLSMKLGTAPSVASVAEDNEAAVSPGDLRLAIIGIGISGFVAMLYEVAWTRLLALVLGSSTHAFSLMLMTFIAGLAIGAWIIARWQSLRRTFIAFAWTELALAATLLGSMFVYEYLPYVFAILSGLLVRKEQAYPLYEFFQAAICFGVMFVPTICLGMTLPLVSRIATSELAQTGRSIGRVFSINTLGTVLGAAVTGLWLMPQLGLARTFVLGVAANTLIGAAILTRHQWRRRPVLIVIGPALGVVLVWMAGHWFERWPRALTLGLWREETPASFAEYRRMQDENQLEYYHDGADATVNVSSFADLTGQRQLRLRVNGKADASTTRDMRTQLMLGHLALLLRAHTERVLVIGLGSGLTCGAVASHSDVRQMDVVEISPAVEVAARWFDQYNGHVLDDPRLRLHIEDAKTYLQITPHRYGAIISEPSNPWMAGVAGVFSAEFYRNCRDRLEDDGLMVQWIHVYESSDQMIDIVLATFTSVFPYVSVWEPLQGDLILLGGAKPWTANLSALETKLAQATIRQDLQRVGLENPVVVLGLEAISQENTRFLPASATRLHTDTDPVLEYVAERAFFARGFAQRWKPADERFSPRSSTLLTRYLQTHALTAADFAALNAWFSTFGPSGIPFFRSLVHRWQHDLPGDQEPLQAMAALTERGFNPVSPLERFASMRDTLFAAAEQNPQPLRSYCVQLYTAYLSQRSVFYLPDSNELEAALHRLLETDPANQRADQLLLAELSWDRGDDRACVEWGQKALAGAAVTDLEQTLQSQFLFPILAHVAEASAHTGLSQAAIKICSLASQAPPSTVGFSLACRKLGALGR